MRKRIFKAVGCGLLTVVCLLAVYWSLTGKMTVWSGEMIRTKIYAIEIRHQKVTSAIDTPAALYLKKVDPEDIRKGSVIYNAES